MIRYHILIALLVTIALLPAPESAHAQDIQAIKSGVVRIVNPELKAQGTGFIVRISPDQSRVSIITASHVVKEAEYCDVYFLDERNVALKGKVTEPEEDETKGLALLEVVGKKGEFSDLEALEIGESSDFKGSENVQVFGFPEGTSICTVTAGNIARLEKRNLVISGNIREGNSGGPVVLNGKVVGLVTDIRSFAYAEQGESIRQYLRGLGLVLPAKQSASSPQPKATPVPVDEFCQALSKLVDAAHDEFYSIVGKPDLFGFEPTIKLPGALEGRVEPKSEVNYTMAKSKNLRDVESAYYQFVSKLRNCFPNWEKKERLLGSQEDGYKQYLFREREKKPIIILSYNLRSFISYRLTLEITSTDYYWLK